MTAVKQFSETQLEELCNILAATEGVLTGSDITKFLGQCGISDCSVHTTKRKRLYDALSTRQKQDGCANNVINFLCLVMSPVRYAHRANDFEQTQSALNKILAFSGFSLQKDGQIVSIDAVTTLDEAEKLAGRLEAELRRRRVHSDILKCCRSELLKDKNYFHAVFEATKSIAEKLRQKSGLLSDGAVLTDEALGIGSKPYPLLAINKLMTESERSEQTGFMNLIKGIFGMYRNPSAHELKIKRPMDEEAALETLTLISMVHHKLDLTIVVPKASTAGIPATSVTTI